MSWVFYVQALAERFYGGLPITMTLLRGRKDNTYDHEVRA